MSTAKYVVGIDLGGTKMAGAVLDSRGRFIQQMEKSTNAQRGPRAVYRSLVDFVHALISRSGLKYEELRGAGLGVPGVVSQSGVVQWAPALKWKDFPLAKDLRSDLKLPVYVENDVNLQALGEYYYGEEQGANPLVYLAIGTGLGSGVVINGQLLTGANSAAGEVCNMVTSRSQLGKSSPGFGYLEGFASGTGVRRIFGEAYANESIQQVGDLDSRQVFARARQGEGIAEEVIREFASYLALAIVNISTVLDPEVIVLGGGVARNADLFVSHLYELCEPVLQVMPRLVVSRLDNAAGIKGAAVMVYDESK